MEPGSGVAGEASVLAHGHGRAVKRNCRVTILDWIGNWLLDRFYIEQYGDRPTRKGRRTWEQAADAGLGQNGAYRDGSVVPRGSLLRR